MTSSFKDFYKLPAFKKQPEPRHRKAKFTDTDPHYRRKHVNLVAKMHQKDLSKNQKIEHLKNHKGRLALEPKDLQYITMTFKTTPDKEHIKMIGNTGISLFFDAQLNAWVAEKR